MELSRFLSEQLPVLVLQQRRMQQLRQAAECSSEALQLRPAGPDLSYRCLCCLRRLPCLNDFTLSERKSWAPEVQCPSGSTDVAKALTRKVEAVLAERTLKNKRHVLGVDRSGSVVSEVGADRQCSADVFG